MIKHDLTLDQMLEITMPFKIVDILEQEDCFEIYVEPEDFYNTQEKLKNKQVEIFESEQKLFPNEKINHLDDEIKKKLDHFIDQCDNDDDIQWVVTNYEEQ